MRSRPSRFLPALAVLVAAASMPIDADATPRSAAPAAAVLPAGDPQPPAAPTDVTAVPGDRSADVTWTAPPNGAKRYRITEVNTGRTKLVTDTAKLTGRITRPMGGLPNRVPLQFTVSAENSAGIGPDSEPSPAVVGLPWIRVSDQLHEDDSIRTNHLTLVLTEKARVPVTIRVRTASTGTATIGTDVEPVDTTVTIPVGKSNASVPITVIKDAVVEPQETLGLELTSDQARQDPRTQPVIVDADSEPVQVSLTGGGTVTEGDSGSKPMTFKVLLSRPQKSAVKLLFLATVNTGSQVELSNGLQQVVLPAGTTLKTVTVGVLGDTLPENPMTVTATLYPVTTAVDLIHGETSGTILDNDTQSPHGADLGVSLRAEAVVDGLGDFPITVSNLSRADASGVVVTVTATTDYRDKSPTAFVKADPRCTVVVGASGLMTANSWWTVWRCVIGAVPEGGRSALAFSLVAGPTGPVKASVGVRAAVTSSPFDDPDHGNNQQFTYLSGSN